MNQELVVSSENNVQLFQNEKFNVRVVVIDGEPWFLAKDICDILGYANATDAINQHCRWVAKYYPIADNLGRQRDARIVNESDMYRLIIKSNLPAAE